MSCDMSCDCSHIPLYCQIKRKRKRKYKRKRNNKIKKNRIKRKKILVSKHTIVMNLGPWVWTKEQPLYISNTRELDRVPSTE